MFLAGEKIIFSARKAVAGTTRAVLSVWTRTRRLWGRIDWQKIIFSTKKALALTTQKIAAIDFRKKNARIGAAAGAAVIFAAIAFSFFRNTGDTNPVSQPAPSPAQENTLIAASDETKAKNIEDISQLAALPPDSHELLHMGDALFALDADKSILKIDLASGETEKIASGTASGKFLLAATMPDLNTIFILTEDKKIISFTPINKKFQENSIALPENLRAAGLKTFLTYIYILDPAANQIYRYPRAEGGFGERQDWLKTGADVKNATSFAINEDLYVATKNQITAFLQGKKDEKINFENPNAALIIDKIYTAPNLENIYVLDNKNHRVVQYGKDGKIAAQYFNPSITNIKDFTVDEKNKTIYLQKIDAILKFSTE